MIIKDYLKQETVQLGEDNVLSKSFNLLLLEFAVRCEHITEVDDRILEISKMDESRAIKLLRASIKIDKDTLNIMIERKFNSSRIDAIIRAFNADKEYWKKFVDERFKVDLINLLVSLSRTQHQLYCKIMPLDYIYDLTEEGIDVLVIWDNMNLNVKDFYNNERGFDINSIRNEIIKRKEKSIPVRNNTKIEMLNFITS